MRRSTLLPLIMAAVFFFSGIAPSYAASSDVVVTTGWVKASEYSDHVGGMTGVFAKITNRSKKTITLTGGSTSFAKTVDVHQVVDGVMGHKPGGIKIAPGKSVILEPGGLHVMMMGLTKKILPGSRVDLKLIFTGATSVALKLTAKAVPAGAESYAPAPMAGKTPSASPSN